MQLTLTAKIKLLPTEEQHLLLFTTIRSIKQALNYISDYAHKEQQHAYFPLHQQLYRRLRTDFGLRSQMAQSALKTVAAKYKSMRSNGVNGTLAVFKKPEYDLVYNRDYTLKNGILSLNTLEGRIKVPFVTKGMDQYFDGTWKLGTAKLVVKKAKFLLYIPVTQEITQPKEHQIQNVVGVDLGLNFLATTYDSEGTTVFYPGRSVKSKRAHFKQVRKTLQQKQTPSARRRLKAIGNRENRWMRDVNHQISKALVSQAGSQALLVLEDLTGIRQATEKVRQKDRYVTVSWAFSQLRQMIAYKAAIKQSKVMVVDPSYTSQTCPKCHHTEKANRNKKAHLFCCKNCQYTSNDDRIGAMNLRRKGIEYLSK